MHACSGVHHKFSCFRLYCGYGRQNPLIGRRKECSFFLSFELEDILGKSPRVSAGASLLSFNLSLRSVLELHSVWTALMRNFDLYFIQRWTFVFSNVCMTYRSSCVVELIPKLWCPSVHSLQTVAARRPAMHNPTVAHFSQQLLHFCHHPSSAFYLVVPQPSSAETSTLCRIYIPILTFKLTFGRMTIVTR